MKMWERTHHKKRHKKLHCWPNGFEKIATCSLKAAICMWMHNISTSGRWNCFFKIFAKNAHLSCFGWFFSGIRRDSCSTQYSTKLTISFGYIGFVKNKLDLEQVNRTQQNNMNNIHFENTTYVFNCFIGEVDRRRYKCKFITTWKWKRMERIY